MYQKTVFRRIQADIKRIGRAAARYNIASYLKALYSLELEGKICFYEQDEDGFPTCRIDTHIAGTERFEPALLFCNTLDASAWVDIDRPDNFECILWNPLTRADLLGCSTMNEMCAECDFNERHNDSIRDDIYFSWVKRMLKLWHENLDIRLTERTGYGLFARRPLPARIFIGEYTGMLTPIDGDLPDDMTVYQFGISIGRLQTEKNTHQPMCWVDATKKGSIFRFMAHSCEPNAEVVNARIGTHHRILAVRTIRPITTGEQITIDYGLEWFTGEQRCLCGALNCRNKP